MNITFSKNWKKANHLTHSGKFHADEVFATVLLDRVHRNIVLSRVQEIDPNFDFSEYFIYDIGRGAYDHHQHGGNGTRPNRSGTQEIKYAACGLVWREYGKEIVTAYLEKHPKSLGEQSFYKIPESTVEKIVRKIDCDFIQFIDAEDNGQELYGSRESKSTPVPNYNPVSLSDVIDQFNPAWNEKTDQDAAFMLAVAVAEKIFDRVLIREVAAFAAETVVEEALEISKNGLLILDKYLTYECALLESENPKAKDILYVVYPSNRSGYNVRAVPLQRGSFKNRKDFPKAWAGLSGSALQEITGVKTATFCHNSRFLAVASTFEDALKLAKLAVAA